MSTIRFQRFVLRLLYLSIFLYWFVARPKTRGVRIIVFRTNHMLMIRQTYMLQNYWGLPGGGFKGGETPLECAVRELREEVGLDASLIYIGVTTLYHSYHHDTVYVFRADVKESDFKIDNIEISEAKWFPAKNLPGTLSILTHHVFSTFLPSMLIFEGQR
jgi:8-oxo-dGTP pyrophosphatase MutT (NUDIX family)